MTQTHLALSLGFAAVILATQAAFSQSPQCGPRDTVAARLAERYGETRRATGLATGAVVEIFASTDTGSWTIAVTTPDGRMCLVAAGQGWQAVDEDLPARGERI